MTAPSLPRTLAASHRTLALIALALIAMLVRLPYVIATVTEPGFTWTWGGEMLSIAHAIVSGEGFASPYGAPTGPTAQQLPVYPYLVAMLARADGGSMESAARAALALNLVWCGLTALVLVALADLVRPGAGLATGWAWALVPVTGFSAVRYLWDTALYTLVLVALFWWFFALVRHAGAGRSPRRELLPFVPWGLFAGASFLLDAAHLLVVGASLLLVLAWRRITAAQASVALASIAVVLAPWIVRNTVALGHVTGIRSNLGYEVYRGLRTSPWEPAAANAMTPGRSSAELARYAGAGEWRYMDAEGRGAIGLAVRSPRLVARRAASRAVAFWWGSPEVERNPWPIRIAGKHLLFALPALAGILGLAFLWRRRRETNIDPAVLGVVAIIFVLLPLPYYFTLTMPRYRAPLTPWFVLMAACGAYEYLRLRGRAR